MRLRLLHWEQNNRQSQTLLALCFFLDLYEENGLSLSFSGEGEIEIVAMGAKQRPANLRSRHLTPTSTLTAPQIMIDETAKDFSQKPFQKITPNSTVTALCNFLAKTIFKKITSTTTVTAPQIMELQNILPKHFFFKSRQPQPSLHRK